MGSAATPGVCGFRSTLGDLQQNERAHGVHFGVQGLAIISILDVWCFVS